MSPPRAAGPARVGVDLVSSPRWRWTGLEVLRRLSDSWPFLPMIHAPREEWMKDHPPFAPSDLILEIPVAPCKRLGYADLLVSGPSSRSLLDGVTSAQQVDRFRCGTRSVEPFVPSAFAPPCVRLPPPRRPDVRLAPKPTGISPKRPHAVRVALGTVTWMWAQRRLSDRPVPRAPAAGCAHDRPRRPARLGDGRVRDVAGPAVLGLHRPTLQRCSISRALLFAGREQIQRYRRRPAR